MTLVVVFCGLAQMDEAQQKLGQANPNVSVWKLRRDQLGVFDRLGIKEGIVLAPCQDVPKPTPNNALEGLCNALISPQWYGYDCGCIAQINSYIDRWANVLPDLVIPEFRPAPIKIWRLEKVNEGGRTFTRMV